MNDKSEVQEFMLASLQTRNNKTNAHSFLSKNIKPYDINTIGIITSQINKDIYPHPIGRLSFAPEAICFRSTVQ